MAVDLGSAEGNLTLNIDTFSKNITMAVSETKTAMSKIESEADGLESSFKSAGDSAGKGLGDGIGKGAQQSKQELGGLESAIDGIKGVAGGLVAAFSFGALVSGIQELVSVANEFQEDMGKLQTAAQATGTTTESANGAYRNMVGLLGEVDRSVEATNHLLSLANGNQQILEGSTDALAGVYARWGDSLPIEGLTEAMNETVAAGQVVGPFADALNWARDRTDALAQSLSGNEAAQKAFNDAKAQGLQNEDAFNAALATTSSEQERVTMITNAMNAMYGETGRQYQENNANLIAYRQSQSDFQAALSNLGTTLMPIVTAFSNFGATLLTSVQPALQFVMQNMNTIGPILAGIATTLGIVTVALTANTVATTAQTVATNLAAAAQRIFNLVMSANPIVLVVSLIAGLVVALISLYNSNETVRNAINTAWTTIQSVVSGVVSQIVTFFTSTIPNAGNSIISFFSSLPGTILGFLNSIISNIASFAISLASRALSAGRGFLTGIQNGFNSAVSFVSSIPGRIISAVGDLGGLLVNAGKSVIDGFLNGLKAAWDGVTGWFADATSSIASLKGPEEVDRKILIDNGIATMEGYLEGLSRGWKSVQGYFSDITSDIPISFVGSSRSMGYVSRFASNGINYNGGTNNQVAQPKVGNTYNFYSPKAIDPIEARRQMVLASREMALGK